MIYLDPRQYQIAPETLKEAEILANLIEELRHSLIAESERVST
jgi:hypothetical protein